MIQMFLFGFSEGIPRLLNLIEEDEDKFLSIQSYMELLQGAKNKLHHKYVKDFITDFSFAILPFTENIGHRVLIYVEEYALSSNMMAGDEIIATTAVENNMTLISSNIKHFLITYNPQPC